MAGRARQFCPYQACVSNINLILLVIFMFLNNRTQDELLDEIDVESTDYLFGLFGESHVPYDDQRKEGQDPSLAEMVTKAIEVQLILMTLNSLLSQISALMEDI